MATSLKKVILRKWNQEWLSGYLPAGGFLTGNSIDLLDLGGKILPVSAQELKWLCFVRDFNSGELANPERLLRKTFAGRPRSAGLWVRLKLADGDLLEGLADNDLSLIATSGLSLVPPDTRSNTQRIYLPATSITELEVLSVIGSSSKLLAERKSPAKSPALSPIPTQPDLFSRP